MKTVETGVVIEIDGKTAKVRASRHGNCKDCGLCLGDSAITVEAQNPLAAEVGQSVDFELQEVNMLQTAFIVYIMPLIAALVGSVFGAYIGSKFGLSVILFEVGGGVIAFILSLIFIKLYDKSAKKNKKMQPVITRITSKN